MPGSDCADGDATKSHVLEVRGRNILPSSRPTTSQVVDDLREITSTKVDFFRKTMRKLQGTRADLATRSTATGATMLCVVPEAHSPIYPAEEAMAMSLKEEALNPGRKPATPAERDTSRSSSSLVFPPKSPETGRGVFHKKYKRRVMQPLDPTVVGVWMDNTIFWNHEHIKHKQFQQSPHPSVSVVCGEGNARNPELTGTTTEQKQKKPSMRISIPERLPTLQNMLVESLDYFATPVSPPKSQCGTVCEVSPPPKITYSSAAGDRRRMHELIAPLAHMRRPRHPLEMETANMKRGLDLVSSSSTTPDRMTFLSTSSDSGLSRSSTSGLSDSSSQTSVDVSLEPTRFCGASVSTDRVCAVMASSQACVNDDMSARQTFPRARKALKLKTYVQESSPSLGSTITSPQRSSAISAATGSPHAGLQIAHKTGASTLTTHFVPVANHISCVSNIAPTKPLPLLPRRSSRRDLKNMTGNRNFSRPVVVSPEDLIEEQISGCAVDEFRTRGAYLLSARPPSVAAKEQLQAEVSADAAETVILRILASIQTFADLFSAARINRGFYSVFKRHELNLMKSVLHSISPAAWELRESSPKEIIAALEGPMSEYTPTRYMQFHTRDSYILSGLKSLILVHCRSYLREDTISALRCHQTTKLSKIDDAFWRIWTFCTIFGSDKGKENDLLAQMDWLSGGVLAHEVECTSNAHPLEAYDSHSAFSKTQDSFAKGNPGGLSANDLYDMLEIWNCLGALLHGIQGRGRTQQARIAGVFDGHVPLDGMSQTDDALLEEWVSYLMTLGLSTILDLATAATAKDESVFLIAAEMGWTAWALPPFGGSRSTFLKEALSRAYGEKIALPIQSGLLPEVEQTEQVKQHRKRRSEELIAELQARRRDVVVENVPFSEERPMSMVARNDEDVPTCTTVKWMNQVDVPESTSSSSYGGLDYKKQKTPSQSSIRPTPLSSRSRAFSGSLCLFPPEYFQYTRLNPTTLQ